MPYDILDQMTLKLMQLFEDKHRVFWSTSNANLDLLPADIYTWHNKRVIFKNKAQVIVMTGTFISFKIIIFNVFTNVNANTYMPIFRTSSQGFVQIFVVIHKHEELYRVYMQLAVFSLLYIMILKLQVHP